MFHFGVETTLYTIPGFGDPQAGSINRYHKKTLISDFYLDLSFGAGGLEEFSIFNRVIMFGLFRQEIKQDSSVGLKGYSLLIGGSSAFDLFKKKGIVYYDQGEYHYDFAIGEQAPQPTEFTDKFAIINLFGPVFDLSLYSGALKSRLSLAAYFDFALVHALALNEYSEDNDIYEPRMKTTLSHYGYYYAFGFTLSGRGSLLYRNFEIKGKIKYQYYDSVENLDRFQDRVVDDCNVNDSRVMYKVSLGYSFAKSPVKLVLACEGIDRWGSLKHITRRESETRLYTQLNLSF